MRRAYKFRAYPTRPQEGRATRLLADHCDLYNAALEERREAWRLRQATITYGAQSAQLKQIRRGDRDGQGRHSFTLRRDRDRTAPNKEHDPAPEAHTRAGSTRRVPAERGGG